MLLVKNSSNGILKDSIVCCGRDIFYVISVEDDEKRTTLNFHTCMYFTLIW